MVSPVAQMILDLIENQLDEADIVAISLATTNKMFGKRQKEEQEALANAAPAPQIYSIPASDIYGSADAAGLPIVVGYKYRIQSSVSPKYLAGITGIAKGKADRSRKRNMIEFEVEPVWRSRCRRYIDPQTNAMGIPGSVLRPFK